MAYHLQIYYMKLIKFILFYFISLNFSYSNNLSCLQATQVFEKKHELPNKLLLSMALTESGRKLETGEFVSWPWTVNYKGKGKFFKSKEMAIDFVKRYTAKGSKNIDLGCMQINYMYHPNAFKSFEDAFDPERNVEWSAKLIKILYEKFGSWKKAVGYYHSYRTSKRTKYSAKVFNTWLDIKKNNKYSNIKGINIEVSELSQNNLENKPPTGNKIIRSSISSNPNNQNKEDKKDKNFNGSPYLMARMEKIRFFRDYFSKTAEN